MSPRGHGGRRSSSSRSPSGSRPRASSGSSTGGDRSQCRTTMPGISALRGRTTVRRPQPPASPLRPHRTAPGPLTSGGLPAADRSNHLAVRPQPCERQRGGDEQQRVQRGDASTNVVLSGLGGAATLSEIEHHRRDAAPSNRAATPGAAGDRCPHRQIGRRSGLPAANTMRRRRGIAPTKRVVDYSRLGQMSAEG